MRQSIPSQISLLYQYIFLLENRVLMNTVLCRTPFMWSNPISFIRFVIAVLLTVRYCFISQFLENKLVSRLKNSEKIKFVNLSISPRSSVIETFWDNTHIGENQTCILLRHSQTFALCVTDVKGINK